MALYIAKPTSRKKIRALTMGLRNIFGLNDVRYFPIIPFLEIVMSEVFDSFNYDIVPVKDMPNQYGVTYPEKNLICLREDVYEGAIDGVVRDRFTVAHEIGHFIMHRPGSIELARSQTVESIPAYKDPEWQANTFAGEILAPPHIITGLTDREIALACGVSIEAARIQLKNI